MIKFYYGPAHCGKTEFINSLRGEYLYLNAAEYKPLVIIDTVLTESKKGNTKFAIDNAHLLNREAVENLRYASDRYGAEIIAAGLRTNSKKHLFPGSVELFAKADELIEMTVNCECGQKAIFSIKVDVNNKAQLYGEDVDTKIQYKAVCSKCYRHMVAEAVADENIMMIRELQEECGI